MRDNGAFSQSSVYNREYDKGGDGGFTLVEILIAVVAVAILAAIAVPAYQNFVQKAREAAVVAIIENITKGEELYRLDSDDELYTGDFTDLEAIGFAPAAPGTATRTYHQYLFTLIVSTGPEGSVWSVTAEPQSGAGDVRYFYADQDGGIHFESGVGASEASPYIS